MYLSPSPNRGSYLNISEQTQIAEDFYSSSPLSQYSNSKKVDKKQRKAQSINEMIRKVEQEIINSEMGNPQSMTDQKSKSSHHSCTNSFSSVLQQQQQQQQYQQQHQQFQQMQPNYMQSHSPRQQSLQVHHQNYYQSAQPHQGYFTPSVKHNSQTHSIDLINQASFENYQDNHHNISRVSTTKQSIFPQNSSHSSTHNSNIFPQQFVTMRDFRAILEEQLVQREQNIIQQVSSCLKEQIIPEIKRQVIKELDKKKQEIDNQIQNVHSTIQAHQSLQYLDDKISNLKISFDRSKFTKTQTDMKTQTLDQKYYILEERMNKLEENTFEHITIFEQYKSENQQTINDFKQANRSITRLNEIVERLSRSYISLEYSTRKNYEEISRKINELDSTEEMPFNIKKDKYNQTLIKELKNQLENQEESADCSSNQTDRVSEVQEKQEPYSNYYKLNVNLKNQDSNSGSKNIEKIMTQEKNISRVLIESFGEYDISPTLGKSAQKKLSNQDKNKGLSPTENCQGQDFMKENSFQMKDKIEESSYDYDYNSKIREVNISNRNMQQILKLRNRMGSKTLADQEIPEQEEQYTYEDEIPRAETQQSVDINYIKKGLPQIFPFVQSTNFMDIDDNPELQSQQEHNHHHHHHHHHQNILYSELRDINQNEIISIDDPIKLSELDLNKQNSNVSAEKDRYQNQFQLGNQIESINVDQMNSQIKQSRLNESQNSQTKNHSYRKETDENNIQCMNKISQTSNQSPIQNLSYCLKKSDPTKQKECLDLTNIVNGKNRILTESENIEDIIQNKIDIHPNFSITDSQF